MISVDGPPVVLRCTGQPRPQGSVRAVPRKGGGNVYLQGSTSESHKAFTSWRAVVAAEGRAWLAANGFPAAYDGAVRVDVLFLLPKPASRPRRERLPRTAYDVDKLTRAVLDGLSVDAPVLRNDSRVCRGDIGKLWAVDTSPGAVIRLTALAETDWAGFTLAEHAWPHLADGDAALG